MHGAAGVRRGGAGPAGARPRSMVCRAARHRAYPRGIRYVDLGQVYDFQPGGIEAQARAQTARTTDRQNNIQCLARCTGAVATERVDSEHVAGIGFTFLHWSPSGHVGQVDDGCNKPGRGTGGSYCVRGGM